jgi:hypothetical protein
MRRVVGIFCDTQSAVLTFVTLSPLTLLYLLCVMNTVLFLRCEEPRKAILRRVERDLDEADEMVCCHFHFGRRIN